MPPGRLGVRSASRGLTLIATRLLLVAGTIGRPTRATAALDIRGGVFDEMD